MSSVESILLRDEESGICLSKLRDGSYCVGVCHTVGAEAPRHFVDQFIGTLDAARAKFFDLTERR